MNADYKYLKTSPEYVTIILILVLYLLARMGHNMLIMLRAIYSSATESGRCCDDFVVHLFICSRFQILCIYIYFISIKRFRCASNGFIDEIKKLIFTQDALK